MKFKFRLSKTATFMVLVLSFLTSPAVALTLKIATVSPEGATWMVKMREAANETETRTSGRVKFKFYSGGVMGSDESVLRKIKVGQLHGGAVTGGSLMSVYPDLSVYSLPFVFRSAEEVDVVRKKMDPLLINGLEEQGFVTFGLAEGGFAYFMSNKKLLTRGDVRQQKVWVVAGDRISQVVLESAGISPIPLPLSDVMTGLQTGLINTVATSPIGAISLQWHTKIKYVTDTPISYFFGMLTVSKKVFDRISENDQRIVREVMSKTFAEINAQNRTDNENARAALIKQGIIFVEVPKEILDDWKNTADSAIGQLIQEKLVNPDLYKMLKETLDSYRGTK